MKAADPFAERASRGALVASIAIGAAGIAGGAVRVLPWAIDPAVPLRVVAPFARSLFALAAEAAIVVGWPLGWALASFAMVERGEALAIAALGERPFRTVMRFAPRGAIFAAVLALASIAGGRDANEPGRVVNELIAQGKSACARATSPTTYVVPFADVTWLCAPGSPPRLVGHPPGALSAATFTAAGATLAGDLRRVDLDDARVAFSAFGGVRVHVGEFALRGLPPWARASTLPAILRALLLVLSSALAALVASLSILAAGAPEEGSSSTSRRLRAIVIAVSGPLAALAILRSLERATDSIAVFALVPAVAFGATIAAAFVTKNVLLRRTRVRSPHS